MNPSQHYGSVYRDILSRRLRGNAGGNGGRHTATDAATRADERAQFDSCSLHRTRDNRVVPCATGAGEKRDEISVVSQLFVHFRPVAVLLCHSKSRPMAAGFDRRSPLV